MAYNQQRGWDWDFLPVHPGLSKKIEAPSTPSKFVATTTKAAQWDGEFQYIPSGTNKPPKPPAPAKPSNPVASSPPPSTPSAQWDGEFQYTPSGTNKPLTTASSKPAKQGNGTSLVPSANELTTEIQSSPLVLTKDETDLVTQGSIPSLYEQFMNFATAQGWDADNDGQVDQAVIDFFNHIAGTTISNLFSLAPDAPNANFSDFTIQWLKNNYQGDPLVNQNDPVAMAQQVIQDIQYRAESLGIDLGNIQGKSAEEVVSIFVEKLAELRNQRAQQLETDGYIPVTQATAEELNYEINSWQGLQHTFGVSDEINTDVMEWVGQNFANVDNTNPQAVEAAVRSYLYTQIYQSGVINLPGVDLSALSLQELTAFVQEIYTNQATGFQAGMQVMSAQVEQAQNPDYSLETKPWEVIVDALDIPVPLAMPLNPDYASLSQHLTAAQWEVNRAQTLFDAFNMNYTAPPDANLMFMVAGMIIDPVDWFASSTDILQYLSQGDYGKALLTAGFALMPFLAGRAVRAADNWIHEGDDIVFGSQMDDVFGYSNSNAFSRGGGSGGGKNIGNDMGAASEGADEPIARSISAEEIGIQGEVSQFDATVTIQNDVMVVRIDMVEGEITNPFEVLENMGEFALSQGAKRLRISGTLANERLMQALIRRYGLITEGGNDYIEIILKED